MDGHFVPNLTIGAPVLKSLSSHLTKSVFLDVHMMVSNPEAFVADFAAAGAHRFTFHIEATKDAPSLISAIRKAGMLPGVALRPGTDLSAVEHVLDSVDLVLIMTVEPGFGGQAFMEAPLAKVRDLRRRFPNLNIEVDGGVAPDTIEQCAEAGANAIVAGSAIFKSQDPGHVISVLRKSVQKGLQN